jgi:hypothetical protein
MHWKRRMGTGNEERHRKRGEAPEMRSGTGKEGRARERERERE